MEEFQVIQRIAELCEARSWSYYRLAKESGIPYSTLSTMLHKTNAPSIPTLEKICNGFGITLSQFFTVEDKTANLTKAQKQCLALWDGLNESSKKLALAYMQGLNDFQKSEE